MIEKIKKNKYLLALILIILLGSFWLITKGMPYQHDIGFHYLRVKDIANSIKNGDFLALIHDSYFGYGYATGLFYCNLFMYIPALLTVFGLKAMTSLKIGYFLINVFTVIFTYFSVKSIVKDKKISVISTVLYTFSSYRITDIFSRGAYGEMLAFMILPIAILGLYELTFRDYKKWYIFTIGFVLMALSHLISTVLLAIFSVVFILINIKNYLKEKNRIKYLIISGIVGVLLGLHFLLPILEQKLYANITIFDVGSYYFPKDYIVSFKNLLIPSTLSSFKTYLGISIILLIPIRYVVYKKKIYSNENLKFADTFYILGIIAWILTTRIFPWKQLNSLVEFIQFPWRLLFISTGFLTFSYAVYFKLLDLKKEYKLLKYIYIFIISISVINIIIYSIQYGFRRAQYNSFGDEKYTIYEYTITGTNTDILDIENPTYYTNNNDIEIEYSKRGTNVTINYKNNKKDDTYIDVPLFNYLGYKAEGAKLTNSDNNLVRLLPNGESGTIKVCYGMTNIQKGSYIISFISLIGFITYIIIEKRRK